ncbi:MAG TPA: hypothetical protein DEP28_12295 [Bacteroidetes bacterium]|nr:hypothetical protein [Bacteroidota bacterium]HRQ31440.1 hypothetical protein [Saprospiraceae bacterium]
MEKKFYIYDKQGRPSSQGFTAAEIKAKGLNPETIVCPELGQPGKLGEFEEFKDWSPPKIDKQKKSIFTGKVGIYVLAAAIVLLGAGAYFTFKKMNDKALTVSQCLEDKRKNEISLNEIKERIDEINYEIDLSNENINTYQNQIDENKNQVINLNYRIPVLQNKIDQATLARDQAARETCYLQACFERRKETVSKFETVININTEEKSSLESEIQQIIEIKIPKLEENINRAKEWILKKMKEIETLENEIQQLENKLSVECE